MSENISRIAETSLNVTIFYITQITNDQFHAPGMHRLNKYSPIAGSVGSQDVWIRVSVPIKRELPEVHGVTTARPSAGSEQSENTVSDPTEVISSP